MCGRVTLDIDIELLKQILEGTYQVSGEQMHIDDYTKRYNVAPGQQVLSVINGSGNNRAGYMKWGYIPPYAQDPKEGSKLINIRSETAYTKPAFKASFQHKRCIILASSFYEWHSMGGPRIPYRVTVKDQVIMPLAGLWSRYSDKSGQVHYTCSVMTTEANDMIKHVHNRMPVILQEEDVRPWIEADGGDLQMLRGLMKQYNSDHMSMYPVEDLVNNVGIDAIECIQRRA